MKLLNVHSNAYISHTSDVYALVLGLVEATAPSVSVTKRDECGCVVLGVITTLMPTETDVYCYGTVSSTIDS